MARVVALRQKLKPELAAQKVNLTYLAFIARATVDTLLDYPWVNGELRGQSIVTRPYVNLGIAVALDEGKGLIVPVIRNAQDLNLTGTARAIQDLAERARTKKLLPDDVQGGTFTITNPGSFGTFHGTPIINQPQSAILGTYALVKRPWVVQDELGGDVIAIRPAHEPHAHVRPPARRRRVRRDVPPRPPRPARELGRGGVLSETLDRQLPLRRRSLRGDGAVRPCRAVPLRVLQAHLGRLRNGERTRAARTRSASSRARSSCARTRLRAGRRRRSARSAARTSSAAAGPSPRGVERTAQLVRPRLRPQARGAHVRPLGRGLGDPSRRRLPRYESATVPAIVR